VSARSYACLFLCFFCASSASAQTTYTWTGAVSGDWGTPGNWSPNGVPGATQNGTDIADALKGLTAVLHDIGMVQGGITTIGGLQYVADRVGGNLERIADQLEKGTNNDDD